MEQFVGVRLIQTNALDLSIFQFDYDMALAIFFLNGDGTIYGRYGTRSDNREAMREISLEGFREAMAGALELHRNYPGNKKSLAGKRGRRPEFPVPEAYPSLGKYKSILDWGGNVARSCVHCHMVRTAQRALLRSARRPMTDPVIYPWPMPNVIGLELDPRKKAQVQRVEPESPAAKAGLRKGDEILSLEGQPILSIADVQWVLQEAGNPEKLDVEILRGDRKVKLALSLTEGWRRKSDISWRVSTWDLRRMALGGLRLKELPESDPRRARLGQEKMALHVDHLGQYGEHATAKNAGFRKGDLLVSFDGLTRHMTETDVIAYVLREKMPGTSVPVTVIRGDRQIRLKLPLR